MRIRGTNGFAHVPSLLSSVQFFSPHTNVCHMDDKTWILFEGEWGATKMPWKQRLTYLNIASTLTV